MEAGSGVASSRGASLPISASRKEWRAVSDQHPVRNTEDEKLERVNMGQPDERTIYEVQHGREPIDVDFCAITMDGGLDNDVLQHRIHDIARQREDLQHMEIELKARMVARSEIIGMQNSFEAQIKEHEDDIRNLQEQLREKEQIMHNLERRIEEKDRELNAIKRDNEDAWVKEDLIREQNKELASFRRERDHSEAERAQHIQQMHDLREHIQEKEQQIHELQEQHRTDQETVYLKDEQLKAWIARAQELESMQSTTNHSLQAELRERVEQYNQLWLHCQRQFAEMERLHLHTIHQLQIELADAREKNGSYSDDSRMPQTNTKDAVNFVQSSGKAQNVNGVGVTSASNGVVPNSNSDHILPLPTGNMPSNQASNVAGLPIAPSSLLGMPAFLPPGQVTALHPFILHQQGIPQSMPSYPPHSHAHFHSVPTILSALQGQQKEVISENAQLSSHNQHASPETDLDIVQRDAKYNYDVVNNGQGLHPDYLQYNISHGQEPESAIPSSSGEAQIVDSIERSYLVSSKSEQSLLHISSQFNETLKLSSAEHNGESEAQKMIEGKLLADEQSGATTTVSLVPNGSDNFGETVTDNDSSSASSDVLLTVDQPNKVAADKGSDAGLLDERSLLACIVRTIPAGGRIRINSTLPNRLGKMLSPLHWHDYKKKYGKLEDFVAGHPELFLIEGDYIQLREGAQEMIAATAAVAKVAAAAALLPYLSSTTSVAVTPLAQSYRSKKELNGTTYDRTSRINAQSQVPNFAGNQRGRATGATLSSRR